MEYIKLREVISSAKTERCGASDYPVLSITKSDGVVLQSDKFKKRIASTDTEQYKLVKRGQLVQGIHIDEANFGIQSIVDIGIVSPAYKIWNVDFQKIVPKYLETVLRSPRSVRYYSSKFNGSVKRRERIADNDFLAMEIPFPSKEQQQYAVDVLEKASNMTTLYQQQLQKLDELVKARFVEMFVATDAASDWPYCTIADVSNDMRTGPFGSALHHDEFVDSGVFVLGIDNAVENKFSYNRMRYITAEKYQELKRYTVYPGDVIITIMGTVGRSAVIPADMPKAINTKHLACITPNAKMVNAQFLSCAFQVHPDIRAQLQKQCKGAIMDGLNLTIIKGLSFHIPPINLQDRFVGFYEQVDKSKVIEAINKANILFNITLNGGNRYDIRANEF